MTWQVKPNCHIFPTRSVLYGEVINVENVLKKFDCVLNSEVLLDFTLTVIVTGKNASVLTF
jgi:hypothetical protein